MQLCKKIKDSCHLPRRQCKLTPIKPFGMLDNGLAWHRPTAITDCKAHEDQAFKGTDLYACYTPNNL